MYSYDFGHEIADGIFLVATYALILHFLKI